MAEPRRQAFGHDWDAHLNRAEGRFRQRLVAALSQADADEAKRGFQPTGSAKDPSLAYRELQEFVEDAVAWCEFHQAQCNELACWYTEDREADVIDRVSRLCDEVAEQFGEGARSQCTTWKGILTDMHIRPRFQDGRTTFRRSEQSAPTAESTARNLDKDAEKEKPAEKPKKRGRKADTDPKADKRIFEAWETRQYSTYADLAKAMNLTAEGVKLARDRHRKRRKK